MPLMGTSLRMAADPSYQRGDLQPVPVLYADHPHHVVSAEAFRAARKHSVHSVHSVKYALTGFAPRPRIAGPGRLLKKTFKEDDGEGARNAPRSAPHPLRGHAQRRRPLIGSELQCHCRARLVAGACLQAVHNAVGDRLVGRWRLPRNGRRSFNSRVSSECVLPKTR